MPTSIYTAVPMCNYGL